jgi:hypothetical protein
MAIEEKYIPEPMSGCWLWIGSLNKDGYGTYNGFTAHNFMFRRAGREIPEGLELDHLCRVRCCVNPDHLEAVTHKVNVLRGISPAAFHAKKTHCVHGHSFTNAYVTRGTGGRLRRECRECKTTYGARHYASKKEKMPW